MYLDPKQEFAQIFNEGWRLQRDYLYVPNLHGTDWPRMKQMYGQLLPHVRHRADLNYLLDNMGAEIAIGHSYVRGGDMPEVPRADRRAARRRLRRRARPLQDHAHLRCRRAGIPICARRWPGPGINVNVGDFIVAINGVELVAPDNIYRLLDGTANRQTVLTVNSQPAMQGARQVTVVPVASEQALRTRAWVEANRRLVDKLSNGQLAYVYVPNTGQGGYQSFNRYYFAQQDKKGAVIDERFNGGGSAADYIIDVLQRDFDGYFNNVAGDRMPVHQSVGRHLGAEGDDHQRDGGLGRRLDAVHVPAPQDRAARRHAHMGRPGAHGRHARLHRWRLDDRAARRVLHARRQVGGRKRRRRRPTSKSRTARRT